MNTLYDMLLLQCEAVATSVDLPFKVPSQAFTPPNDGKWLEFIVIPNGEAVNGWQDLKTDQGIFRALVYWPPGQGTDAPGVVCEAIAEHFAQGSRWHSSPAGSTVEIYAPPQIGGLVEDGQAVYFPVSMRYRVSS